MFWLRTYELHEIDVRDHRLAFIFVNDEVGPGFLNVVNRYYGYQVWR